MFNESQVPCKKPRFDRSPSHVQIRNAPNGTKPQLKNATGNPANDNDKKKVDANNKNAGNKNLSPTNNPKNASNSRIHNSSIATNESTSNSNSLAPANSRPNEVLKSAEVTNSR